MQQPFETHSGIRVEWAREILEYPGDDVGIEPLIDQLDSQQGAYFSSGVEYPGRYSRWDFGFSAPPIEIVARGNRVVFNALNPRGERLLEILAPLFENDSTMRVAERAAHKLKIEHTHLDRSLLQTA